MAREGRVRRAFDNSSLTDPSASWSTGRESEAPEMEIEQMDKKLTEHSPLPWRLLEDGFIYDANGQYVGTWANRHLIIAAVNAHASYTKLLAAANEAVLVMKDTRILGIEGRIDLGIKNLQAAIDAAEEPVGPLGKMEMKWHPIETAQKDGTDLILSKWVGHSDHTTALWWITRGHWSSRFNNWNDGVEPSGLAGPTHWMLKSDLPKP